jgi:hypothetical protein
MFMLAFSTDNKKMSLEEKHNRAVNADSNSSDDGNNPFDDTLDGVFLFFKDGSNPFDDILEEEYEVVEDDPDTSEIMVKSTNSNIVGYQRETGDVKRKLNVLPRAEGIKLTQEPKDHFFSKLRQIQFDDKPFLSSSLDRTH